MPNVVTRNREAAYQCGYSGVRVDLRLTAGQWSGTVTTVVLCSIYERTRTLHANTIVCRTIKSLPYTLCRAQGNFESVAYMNNVSFEVPRHFRIPRQNVEHGL